MKKVLLLSIPTILIILLAVLQMAFGFDINNAPDFIIIFLMNIVLFFAPCYYTFIVYLTSSHKKEFIALLMYSILLVLINAVIICAESIKVYLGIQQWKGHDMDFFPFFAIFPVIIIVVGVGLTSFMRIAIKYVRHSTK